MCQLFAICTRYRKKIFFQPFIYSVSLFSYFLLPVGSSVLRVKKEHKKIKEGLHTQQRILFIASELTKSHSVNQPSTQLVVIDCHKYPPNPRQMEGVILQLKERLNPLFFIDRSGHAKHINRSKAKHSRPHLNKSHQSFYKVCQETRHNHIRP